MVVIGGSTLCRLIEANRRCHQTWHGRPWPAADSVDGVGRIAARFPLCLLRYQPPI